MGGHIEGRCWDLVLVRMGSECCVVGLGSRRGAGVLSVWREASANMCWSERGVGRAVYQGVRIHLCCEGLAAEGRAVKGCLLRAEWRRVA